MEMRGYEVAQKYVRYRYKRELMQESPIQQITEFLHLLIILMKKSIRKIPIRTLVINSRREIIWQEK